jgi:hypothetical protein
MIWAKNIGLGEQLELRTFYSCIQGAAHYIPLFDRTTDGVTIGNAPNV